MSLSALSNLKSAFFSKSGLGSATKATAPTQAQPIQTKDTFVRQAQQVATTPTMRDAFQAEARNLINNAKQLATQAANATSSGELIKINAQLQEIKRNLDTLGQASKLDDKLAANPKATTVDRMRFMNAAAELLNTRDTARQGRIMLELEDIVRNAGRPMPSDRGLYNATQMLQTKVNQVEQQMRYLAHQAALTTSPGELVKITVDLDLLKEQQQALLAIKSGADRLADQTNPAPERIDNAKALIAAVVNTNDLAYIMRIANAF